MNVLLAPSMSLFVAAKLPFDALLGAIWAANLTADLTSIEPLIPCQSVFPRISSGLRLCYLGPWSTKNNSNPTPPRTVS
jgi:hypothetical protein